MIKDAKESIIAELNKKLAGISSQKTDCQQKLQYLDVQEKVIAELVGDLNGNTTISTKKSYYRRKTKSFKNTPVTINENLPVAQACLSVMEKNKATTVANVQMALENNGYGEKFNDLRQTIYSAMAWLVKKDKIQRTETGVYIKP